MRRYLDNLIFAYFNQDFDLSGDSIEAIAHAYRSDNLPENWAALLSDIDAFVRDHPRDLEEAFESAYGRVFSASLWGHDARSFLQVLRSVVAGK